MTQILRIAVLVDLPRDHTAGGQVKYWERLAQACVKENPQLDMTVYFSGCRAEEILSPRVRIRTLPPVFSTARLKFLPYVPAHTDLAPFHRQLAQELPQYDVLHTTDGYFAFARTAERIARDRGIPLVSSFHTDTPAYAELFTQQTLQILFGKRLGSRIDSSFHISRGQRRSKEARLKTHLRACSAVFATRPEDRALAQQAVPLNKILPVHKGVNKNLFAPNPDARNQVEAEYGIANGKFLILFVGRVDEGKNARLLMEACVQALQQGVNLHLIVVGIGPLSGEIKAVLKDDVTLTGLLPAEKLAKLYAAADCLASVSDIEIGGLIGAEAIACGCPVLASKVSGVVSFYGNPPAMEEIERGVLSWADAFASLARDSAKQSAMREGALAFREERLDTWEDVLMRDFLPVWQRVAKKGKP